MTEELLRRLVDMQQEQAAVNAALLVAINRLADGQTIHPQDTSAIDEFDALLKRKMADLNSVDVSTMPTGQQIETIYSYERIVENGKQYTRKTHPLLFAVVDYLEENPSVRGASTRKIAEMFTQEKGQSVGKSWAAVAKNYWQNN